MEKASDRKDLKELVNSCIQNALKGKAIELASEEMTNLVAYVKPLKGITPKAGTPNKEWATFFHWQEEKKGADARIDPLNSDRDFYRYFWIRISAIWTAFSAAPFRILSETIHILMPLGIDSSSRILPTKVSSLPAA